MSEISEQRSPVSKLEAVGFVWEVFSMIAIPTTCLALAGRAIDTRFQTSPYATAGGLILALVISGVLVLRKARSMAARLSGKS